MEIGITGPNFRELFADLEGHVATAATEAMRGTTYKTLLELRRQVTDNGLGVRLANTWRDRIYPEKRKSMTPTGFIWSNAPDIIEGFTRGATIRPVGAAQYLWIPTKNVPRSRARVNRRGQRVKGGAMSPEEVENAFNDSLFVRKSRKAGTLLAFINVVRSRNGRSFRPQTAGRSRQGRKAEPVLMFVLTRTVRLPKLLDLQGPAQRWEERFAAEFLRRMAL